MDGVRFVNDSQGTQPDAVIAAVRSFPPPVVLICGGRAKGVAMDDLAAVVAERVTAAVLIGESGPELGALFVAAGLAHTERAGSMDEAVRVADRIARAERSGADADDPPATVLLSPAAASFDMYPDYAARGRDFKRVVAELIDERSSRGGPVTANARPRVAGQLPLWGAPAPALPLDGVARTGAWRHAGGRPADVRDPRHPAIGGAKRRPDRSTVAARPIDRAPVPRPSARELAAGSQKVKGPVRERHEVDPWLLIATVALSAVGMLMIYSTSAASLSAIPPTSGQGDGSGVDLGGTGHRHDAGPVPGWTTAGCGSSRCPSSWVQWRSWSSS